MKRTIPETLQRIWADAESADDSLRLVIESMEAYEAEHKMPDHFLYAMSTILKNTRTKTQNILYLMKNE